MSKAVSTKTHRHDPFALARSFFGYDPFFNSTNDRGRARFTPAFEVKESADGYILIADIPGVKEGDLDVSLHRNVLTVSGNRQSEERKSSETYYVYERQYGGFSRSFSLLEAADGESVSAALDAGVLTVTIAKKAESKPRKIALQK